MKKNLHTRGGVGFMDRVKIGELKGKLSLIIKDKRTWVILAIVILILIIGIFIFTKKDSNRKNELLFYIFDEEKPVIIKKDGKYGYVNLDGELLIQPVFESAEPFYKDHALVSTLEDEEEKYKIIDKKGEIVLDANGANRPRYFSEYDVWLIDNKLYSKDLEKVFEDDYHMNYLNLGYFSYQDNTSSSSGIIDYKGNKVFSWDENYISVDISKIEYVDAEYYASISNYEERESIIDLQNGKEIFTLEDPKNQYLEVEDDNIFRVIDRSDSYKTIKWIYVKDGKIVYETGDEIYDITIDDFDEDILKLDYGVNFETQGKNERYEYYSVKDKKFMNESYGKEESTNKNSWMEKIYGYRTYTCSGLAGIMSKTNVLLDCTHSNVKFLNKLAYNYMFEYHNSPLAIVEKDTDVFIFDMKKGETLESFEVASLKEIDESTFVHITSFEDDGFTRRGYIVYNLITHESKELPVTAEIEIFSNYITIEEDDKKVYYDTNLKKFYEGEI